MVNHMLSNVSPHTTKLLLFFLFFGICLLLPLLLLLLSSIPFSRNYDSQSKIELLMPENDVVNLIGVPGNKIMDLFEVYVNTCEKPKAARHSLET